VRIEFALLGDGTNVEVLLLEDLGGWESVRDRFSTATHQFPFCMVPGSPQCDYEETFYDLELVMQPPKIGGRYAWLHPYWHERAEKRRLRESVGILK
jgi:hypothetical protein